MNLLGRFASLYLPATVRRVLLERLFTDTAAAFDSRPPPLHRLAGEQLLNAFVEFTATTALQHAGSRTLASRLFEVTYGHGEWLRRAFGVASIQDAMAAARLVYRAIGIEFEGNARGEIIIRSCSFSRAYTPEVCKVMSALDAGLLAGLSSGRRLSFSQRITEGYPACLAELVKT